MIDFGVQHFAGNRFVGTRRVIDISGDGANNHGRDLAATRDEAVAAGITINGLPMAKDRLSKFGWPHSADVDRSFAHHVIVGPAPSLVAGASPHFLPRATPAQYSA